MMAAEEVGEVKATGASGTEFQAGPAWCEALAGQ